MMNKALHFAAQTTLVDGLLAGSDADFPRKARQFREELAPRNLLEGLQVDLAIMALAMLRRAIAALADAATSTVELKAQRAHARAHAMLTQALREFHRLRKQPTASPAAEPVAVTEAKPAPAAPEARRAPVAPPTSPPRAPSPPPRPAPPPRARPALDAFAAALASTPAVLDLTATRPLAACS